MNNFRNIFFNSEPLLLFAVIGLGYLFGQLKIKGFKLGISGVLFVGLLFGGWKPEGTEPFHIAPQIREVGLILFVYIVGLTSGPGFFASFRKRGVKFNIIVFSALVVGAALTLIIGRFFKLPIGQIAGVYCGGLTNTPALAAVTELTKTFNPNKVTDPAIGYSLAYPYGVIGGLLAFHLFFKIFSKAFRNETALLTGDKGKTALIVQNFVIKNPALFGKVIGELRVRDKTGVIISRHKRDNKIIIPTKYTTLNEGDIIVTVGKSEDIEKAKDYFGDISTESFEMSENIDMRRILVSRRELVGKKIEELGIDTKFNAQITRLRRADIEIIPSPETVLELGDRLRVVMPTEKIEEVSKFFGDSVRGISELDYTAITLGISLGVLIGMIPIPIPGGTSVKLGFAGGPLIVGLILGRLSRTGPVVWSIPLESSQALSHIGLLIFLAGVGITSGDNFFASLTSSGWQLLVLGFFTTSITTFLTLFLLRFLGKASVVDSLGATSGMQTQPATLACAYQLTQSNDTYVAYATTYPVSMIGKILLAQLIFILGQGLLK